MGEQLIGVFFQTVQSLGQTTERAAHPKLKVFIWKTDVASNGRQKDGFHPFQNLFLV